MKTEQNNILEHFIHLFEYNSWATAKTVEAVLKYVKPESRANELLSHIISSQKIWLGRTLNKILASDPWGKISPENYISQSNELTSEWMKLLRGVNESGLERKIEYKNTKGESFSNTVKDIITHVINHSTYHRAQIAQLIRQSGGEPAKTDYIVYQRELKK